MCYLLVKQPNEKIPLERLKRGYQYNRHGCGFAFAHNNELILEKGFFDFDDFLKEYEKVPDESPAIIHMRSATSGIVNKENCHPFLIDQQHAIGHFGGFACHGDGERSDTRQFTEDFLRPLFKETDKELWQTDMKIEQLMDKMLRGRAAILDNKGRIQTYGY